MQRLDPRTLSTPPLESNSAAAMEVITDGIWLTSPSPDGQDGIGLKRLAERQVVDKEAHGKAHHEIEQA